MAIGVRRGDVPDSAQSRSLLTMPLRLFLPFALAVAALCASCKPAAPALTPPTTGTATYEVRGILQKLDVARGKAVIAHDAIPGYMEAMTMEFSAADGALAALEPGDELAFRLTVTESRAWIDAVRKTGHITLPASAKPALEPLAPGAVLPDCALVDQHDQAIRLRDFPGRALAFTFIFTRCPLPTFCPLMNRHFADVQRELGSDDTRTNWQLLSISLDPAYDTPERLAKYAESYQPNERHWRFATGTDADIEKLGAAFGLTVARNGGQTEHNLRTVVVDAAGRVQKVFVGNEWTAEELIADLRRAMAVKP